MYSAQSRPTDFEVFGQLGYAIISNIQSVEVQPLLKRYGLDNIQLDEWYSAKQFAELFEAMLHLPNVTTNFVAIGMAAAGLLVEAMPPELKSVGLEQILMLEEELLFTNYRNGDAGYVHNSTVDDNTFLSDTRSAWPDDLIYGFAFGYIRRFCPAGKRFTIRKDPNLPGQDEGGEFLRLITTIE